jgi:hypothetical protein
MTPVEISFAVVPTTDAHSIGKPENPPHSKR